MSNSVSFEELIEVLKDGLRPEEVSGMDEDETAEIPGEDEVWLICSDDSYSGIVIGHPDDTYAIIWQDEAMYPDKSRVEHNDDGHLWRIACDLLPEDTLDLFD